MDRIIVTVCPACGRSDFSPWMQVKDYRMSQEVFELLRCDHCELIITQHQPPTSEITRYYETEDYISHSDERTKFIDRVYYAVRKVMLRKKATWISRFATADVLVDIGTGSGAFVKHMQERGWNVRGFEPNARARESALRSHQLTIHEIEALFELPGNSVDAVTMWHVLEHVHDPVRYLQHIHSVLKERGALFLALPNHRSFDAHFYGDKWAAWDVPRHLWHFGPNAVGEITTRTGFNVVHRYIMPFDAVYVSLMSESHLGGGMLRQIRGMCVGLTSLVLSWFSRNKSSSIVYVCKKVSRTSKSLSANDAKKNQN